MVNKKAKGIFAIGFSVIISLITVFMINEYLNKETSRRVKQASADTFSVIVFSENINAGTEIAAKNLLVREYPSHLMNQNWFLKSEAGAVIGKELRVDVKQGEPVSKPLLFNRQNAGLSRQLPEGYYAITVATDSLGHHRTLLKPGDVVDIAFMSDTYRDKPVKTSFSGVEVFDIHGGDGGYGNVALTLLLKPEWVGAFTKAMGQGMLVWARSESLANQNPWRAQELTTQVMSWTAQ